jgi:hypothetical protein
MMDNASALPTCPQQQHQKPQNVSRSKLAGNRPFVRAMKLKIKANFRKTNAREPLKSSVLSRPNRVTFRSNTSAQELGEAAASSASRVLDQSPHALLINLS